MRTQSGVTIASQHRMAIYIVVKVEDEHILWYGIRGMLVKGGGYRVAVLSHQRRG